MESTFKIERILSIQIIRLTLESLLINDNSTIPVKIGQHKYIVNNRCSFYFVSIIITMAYIDNPKYK